MLKRLFELRPISLIRCRLQTTHNLGSREQQSLPLVLSYASLVREIVFCAIFLSSLGIANLILDRFAFPSTCHNQNNPRIQPPSTCSVTPVI